jgi:hypothetical protein
MADKDLKPSDMYQKELKELYETGTTQRQIDAAKAKNKELADQLMQQGIDLAGPKDKVRPVQMPELKTKDTGDKNKFDIKGTLPKGYENAKPVKKGGMIKKMKKGGSVGSASKRADGCATKGKTKGRII